MYGYFSGIRSLLIAESQAALLFVESSIVFPKQ